MRRLVFQPIEGRIKEIQPVKTSPVLSSITIGTNDILTFGSHTEKVWFHIFPWSFNFVHFCGLSHAKADVRKQKLRE